MITIIVWIAVRTRVVADWIVGKIWIEGRIWNIEQLLLLAEVWRICKAPVVAESVVLDRGKSAWIAWIIGPVVHGLSTGKRNILREVKIVRGGEQVAANVASAHDIHRRTGINFDVRLRAEQVVGEQVSATAGKISLDRHRSRAEWTRVLQLNDCQVVEPRDQAGFRAAFGGGPCRRIRQWCQQWGCCCDTPTRDSDSRWRWKLGCGRQGEKALQRRGGQSAGSICRSGHGDHGITPLVIQVFNDAVPVGYCLLPVGTPFRHAGDVGCRGKYGSDQRGNDQ